MPKLIDYPRTTYSGAWELAEVTDDTGGKCSIETAAKKLNRKVSGSFKAIIGSAVKFGLLTSKRDLLTTTTLFKRIKHAYDKQEEILFHREAFLTPPLFTQLCRKFRSKELPVQMLDVMLIREFNVEEINAPGVAKAFVEGCRMIGLLDEHNIIADIDALGAKQAPRRELASPPPILNTFRQDLIHQGQEPNIDWESGHKALSETDEADHADESYSEESGQNIIPTAQITTIRPPATSSARNDAPDAIASLFGLLGNQQAEHTKTDEVKASQASPSPKPEREPIKSESLPKRPTAPIQTSSPVLPENQTTPGYQIQVTGPGINTVLSIIDEEDIAIAAALLEKVRRQLKR